MRDARQMVVAALGLTLAVSVAPAAGAQQTSGFWEIGTDAALTIGLDNPKFVSLAIPAGLIRAGYFTTPTVSIEPLFQWFSVGTENTEGFSVYTLGVGVLFHRSVSRTAQQVYLRPFLLITDGSGGANAALTFGGGVGVKRPLLGGRAATRAEANASYNEASERLNLSGQLGLSLYTR